MAAVLQLAEGAAPSTPGSGYHDLYFDTSGLLHILTDGGANTTVATTDIVAATVNIADEAVTNAKLAHMAEETIKGRASGAGTGDATDLTAAQVGAILAGEFPALGDAAWTDLTLTTGWTVSGTLYPTSVRGYTPTYAAPGYRKVGGIVYLRGAVNCDSATATPIATLPADYRPAAPLLVNVVRSSSASQGTLYLLIGTDGTLQVNSSDTSYTYFFDGICFPV